VKKKTFVQVLILQKYTVQELRWFLINSLKKKRRRRSSSRNPANMKHELYKATNRSFFLLYIYIYIFFYNRYRNSDLVDHFETNKWNWLKKKQKKKPINNEYPLEEKRKTNKESKDSYEQHNKLRGHAHTISQKYKTIQGNERIVDVFHGNRVTILLS